ncbi:hypothetical protein [Streptomyces sp. MBT33]|uniref:hypothetical protein n=1 Tax=Streptomyces sp. MBT33 TaxID=1488363 RepID=UPI00190CC2FE|nr:hypothetical protein [Streptomyces sp. MBT33]MBK3639890.1 hypothetical protein [Streptomyces sp. MBT33]
MTMDACGPSAPDATTARRPAAFVCACPAPGPASRAVTTEAAAEESAAPYTPHIHPRLGAVPHRESHVR